MITLVKTVLICKVPVSFWSDRSMSVPGTNRIYAQTFSMDEIVDFVEESPFLESNTSEGVYAMPGFRYNLFRKQVIEAWKGLFG